MQLYNRVHFSHLKVHIITAAKYFLDWKSTHTTKAFIDYYRPLQRFHACIPKPLSRLSVSDVALFQRLLKTKYGLGAYSVAQSMVVIKNFLKFCKQNNYKSLDPSFIRINKNFQINSHTPVTPEDFNNMDSVLGITGEDLKKKCVIHLLWHTGVRVSELCDLLLIQIGDESRAYIKNKKNPNFRWIFWPASTQQLLKKHVKIRSELYGGKYLFMGEQGRLTPRCVQRWIKEICVRAKILKKLSPHSFRHGFSHLRKDKIATLSLLLGHSNISSTQHYLKLNPGEIEKEAVKFFE